MILTSNQISCDFEYLKIYLSKESYVVVKKIMTTFVVNGKHQLDNPN
jgi:hypothetical protein